MNYTEVSQFLGQLKLESLDGKKRATDCANTETLFRIIQSIPSPKAGTIAIMFNSNHPLKINPTT